MGSPPPSSINHGKTSTAQAPIRSRVMSKLAPAVQPGSGTPRAAGAGTPPAARGALSLRCHTHTQQRGIPRPVTAAGGMLHFQYKNSEKFPFLFLTGG